MPIPIPICTGGNAGAQRDGSQHGASRRRNDSISNMSTSISNNGGMSMSIGAGPGSYGAGMCPMSFSNSYSKSPFGTSFRFLSGASSGSYKGSTPMSYGKDVNEMMDYSIAQFATSTWSETQVITPSSLSSKLETTFCRNFTCCGQELDDLHDLLQHYEECHVRFDDTDEFGSNTPPGMVNDDGSSEDSSNSSSPSSPKSIAQAAAAAAATNAAAGNKAGNGTPSVGMPISNPLSTPGLCAGAAANSAAGNNNNNRKRSFNQFSTTPSNSSSVMHQSLRRALIDGGIAGARRQASPYSTPGGSIPGTPVGEPDLDALLGGHGGATAAFSALSLRNNNFEEHNLPSCAPPNLFFPANGVSGATTTATASGTVPSSSTNSQPPSKRERLNSSSSGTMPNPNTLNPDGTPKFDPKNVIMLPGNIEKPYKCPAPGCDKAYKQMNGLKYHRLHGHCNQNNVPILQTATAQAALIAAQQQQASSSSSLAGQPGGASAASSPVVTTPGTATTPTGAPKPGFFTAATVAAVMATTSAAPGISTQTRAAASTTPNSTAPNSPYAAVAAALPGSPAGSSASISAGADRQSTPAPAPAALSSTSSSSVSAGSVLAGQASVMRAGSQNNKQVLYLCQVGTCGKTYKNLNGLRYHYLHSGSHGLLGLQVLHANGGGNSAKMGNDGRALVSTDTLKPEEVARAARLAAEMQAKKSSVTQKTVEMVQAQALAGGGPGHNHKQAQDLEKALASDEAP
ncbi:hypothetical protein K437DRAFT_262259 [Tilletiaria anomala UBC 951]|uniref:C2H2-type domain-containing protein n=1 Tax=Tilletiaria anomala (strain ATCC 24038 / CBS 436.72 / UBC 951) TaxID=1037660 RepID=A0A066WBJ8_TILAU|nr:uncharacterized protein K437DRAFT_262259 [Tilletiaria anomala UBC 951]KDN48459.1 hypothetical protein K437DRAFT_262259 [Tilletiaria anomala UBC 951]